MQLRVVFFSMVIALSSLTANAQSYLFESLDFNAGCGSQFCSFARGINNPGDIVGWGQFPFEAGFLLDKHGELSLIEFPGAVRTRASGINDRGAIVGQYNAPDGSLHAFLRDQHGVYMNIDFPGSASSTAWGINARGQAVGDYSLPGEPLGVAHAYVSNPDGTFESFDYPAGMVPAGMLFYTRFRDINDQGQIVGIYRVVGGTFAIVEVHGFFLDTDGTVTPIDYPVPPPMGENFFVTVPLGINNRGTITGGYLFGTLPPVPAEHGFVRSPDGQYETVDFPGADITEIYKSSESGELVGGYRIAGESNAFVAEP